MVRICLYVHVCVALPMIVGVWLMAVMLHEYYYCVRLKVRIQGEFPYLGVYWPNIILVCNGDRPTQPLYTQLYKWVNTNSL